MADAISREVRTAPERVALSVGLQHLVAVGDGGQPALEQRGEGDARADAVHRDAVPRQIERERRARHGSAARPWTCSRRTCRARPAARRGWRAARWRLVATRAHVARGLTCDEEGAAHVDPHDVLEVLRHGVSNTGPPSPSTPAQAMAASISPSARRVSAKASTTVCSSPVSPLMASARRPICSMRSAAAAAAPGVQSSTATSAPRSARVSAVSRPMPEPPPVTNAVLPLWTRPGWIVLSVIALHPCGSFLVGWVRRRPARAGATTGHWYWALR